MSCNPMAAEPAFAQQDEEFTQLVARIRQGDESAASELVGRYERAVLRCVRGRLGTSMRSTLDSMDVVQSVHRSLLIGLRNKRFQLTTPQQLIGLAVIMVQRKVARHWRRLQRIPVTALDRSFEHHAATVDQLASLEPAPPDVAAANDLLEQFLAQLDELDRQLVHLKLDGHNSVDAAAALGREPAFVRMRWARLRQQLRQRGYTND
jgi:DNA-directed RNA polymerase specialized sigma24 family protein